jgi:hypothetical protein
MQPTSQCPIFHCHHPSNRSERVAQFPTGRNLVVFATVHYGPVGDEGSLTRCCRGLSRPRISRGLRFRSAATEERKSELLKGRDSFPSDNTAGGVHWSFRLNSLGKGCGVAEIDGYVGPLSQILMAGQFGSLVPGQGTAQMVLRRAHRLRQAVAQVVLSAAACEVHERDGKNGFFVSDLSPATKLRGSW